VTVRVHDDGGTANGSVDTSAPQTFTITIFPVVQSPQPAPMTPVTFDQGVMFSNAVIARFTIAGGGPASQYSAVIDWGDGTASSGGAAIIVQDSPGSPTEAASYHVLGSHSYSDSGTFTISVTVSSNSGGPSVTLVSQAIANSTAAGLSGA